MMTGGFRKAVHRIFGVILLVLGVFLLLQAHDLSRTFLSGLKNWAFGWPGERVTYLNLAGWICCGVGLVEFFRSEKR